ncbi:MAG: ComF family protein [Bacteroidia bacterium]|nr:ComF family protein [Bacteroidia bacterium]NNJ56499.1 ComF family protein [Bacteroidia bacterium]
MKKILASVGNMLFPNICISCESYLSFQEKWICDYCYYTLPKFEDYQNSANMVAQMFWGRVKLEMATSYLQFKSTNHVQKVLHQIKYRGNTGLAEEMGKNMGICFKQISAISNCDVVVPIPLHRRKKEIRGYNQSYLLAKGLCNVINRPLDAKSVERTMFTKTQTNKKRFDRHENTKNVFKIHKPNEFENRHVLLVDDVITTGATIEACATELLKIKDCKVSVCSLAVSN